MELQENIFLENTRMHKNTSTHADTVFFIYFHYYSFNFFSFLVFSTSLQSLTSLVAWVQIDLKCPSNIFLINIFLQEMAHFNPNSFWNNVLVQNKTVEKYSNVHSLVKPIESIFAKTKVLSPRHMMHPILD